MDMKSNVRLRSNVVLRGDVAFERHVRGSEAVIKLLTIRKFGGKCLHVSGNDGEWRRFRTSVLEPAQILDVAWQLPCSACGSKPEGLVRGNIQFRCPWVKCVQVVTPARTINFRPEVLARATAYSVDIHRTVQAALEQFGREYSIDNSLLSREQISKVIRLNRYQHLVYSDWTQKELSDHVERALLRLIGGT